MIYNVYECYTVEVEMLCNMCMPSNVRSMCISASTYASFMQASSIHGGLVHCIHMSSSLWSYLNTCFASCSSLQHMCYLHIKTHNAGGLVRVFTCRVICGVI